MRQKSKFKIEDKKTSSNSSKKKNKITLAQLGLDNKPFVQTNTFATNGIQDNQFSKLSPEELALHNAAGGFKQFQQQNSVTQKDNNAITDIDNGPVPENDPLALLDPRRTQLHPAVQAFNTGAYAVTGIANIMNNNKLKQQESKQYLNAIRPNEYENMERYGLNANPVFTKFGGYIPDYAFGGGEDPTKPTPPRRLNPNEMNQWNQYLDFVDKKGFKGSKDLDNRDKGLGASLFNEFKQSNPNISIGYDIVPSVQHEMQQQKKWQSDFLNRKGTPADDPMGNISKTDGWFGSLTSQERFVPTTQKTLNSSGQLVGSTNLGLMNSEGQTTSSMQANLANTNGLSANGKILPENANEPFKGSDGFWYYDTKDNPGELIRYQTGGATSNLIEAEQGEAIESADGSIGTIGNGAPTHEEGGVIVPDAHRVLENTSSLRNDKNSKYLKLSPEKVKGLTGLDTNKSMSHAEALDKAAKENDKMRVKILKKIDLASKDKKTLDKYAQNSIELNLNTAKALPSTEELFDTLFQHQEGVKQIAGIETGDKGKYGGEYQTGGYTNGLIPIPKYRFPTPSSYGAIPTGTDSLEYKRYFNEAKAKGDTWFNEHRTDPAFRLMMKSPGSGEDSYTKWSNIFQTMSNAQQDSKSVMSNAAVSEELNRPFIMPSDIKKKLQLGGFPGSKDKSKTPAGHSDAFPSDLKFEDFLKDLKGRGFNYEGINDNKALQTALYNYKLENGKLDDIRNMWSEGMHKSGMAQARALGFVDDKGLFKPGVLDSEENLKKLGELYPDGMLGPRLLKLAGDKKPPRIWQDEQLVEKEVPKQKGDTSITNNVNLQSQAGSRFNEPLRWFDVASPINAYLASLERLPEKYNPAEFNQLRFKLQDPTAALNQNQADFNAASKSINNSGAGAGSQMANIANLVASKYSANNQVLGNTENQNAQIKNNEITYNTQVRDKQSVSDQQSRELFEQKVLTSKAKQQEQKLTALDSLFKTIAENRALNRNGNLIMKFSNAFDQFGDFNGYQHRFGINPAAGIQNNLPPKDKTTAAGRLQKIGDGMWYNSKTGKTFFFDGKNLQER